MVLGQVDPVLHVEVMVVTLVVVVVGRKGRARVENQGNKKHTKCQLDHHQGM